MTRVLIVDDRDDNLNLLRALLESSGYVVDQARHGAEALAIANREPPDLIISDLLMPVMDGYALCRQWKAEPRLANIPFVVYTATYTDPRDKELALNLGADAFILKPAEPDAFLERIQAILSAKRTVAVSPAHQPAAGEVVLLRESNETPIRKLEDKLAQIGAANVAIRGSEQKLHYVLDGLGPSMFVGLLTPEGILLYANQPALGAANLEPEDVLAKPFDQTYWWSYSERVQEQLRSAIRQAAAGTPCRYDVQVRVAPESLIWIDFSLHPLRDDSGRVEYLVPSASVIDDRKRAEEALRRSEQRFRLAASSGQVWDWDIVTNTVSFPPEFWHSLGYEDPEIENSVARFESILHPEDREGWRKSLKDHIGPRLPYDLEYRARAKSGEYLWFHTSGQAVWDESWQATYMAGTTFDITERKRAEKRLRESEEQYRRMVNLSPDAVTIHQAGRWVFANAAAARILGVKEPSQLVGRSLLDFMHPDVHDKVKARWKVLYEDKQPIEMAELKMVRPDGTIVYLETRAVPVTWQGQPAAEVVARDMTERKRTDDTLRSYTERLQGLSRRLMEVEEAERRNINRELHDRIGQNLSALSLAIDLVRSSLTKASLRAVGARLDAAQKLLEATTTQVRDVMAELHPPALDDYGLLPRFAPTQNPSGQAST